METPGDEKFYKVVLGEDPEVPHLILEMVKCAHDAEENIPSHRKFLLQFVHGDGPMEAKWFCGLRLDDAPPRDDVKPSPVPRAATRWPVAVPLPPGTVAGEQFDRLRAAMREVEQDRDYWRTAAIALCATFSRMDESTAGWEVEATPEGLQAMLEEVLDDFELIEKSEGPGGGRYFGLVPLPGKSAHRLGEPRG